jgi:hypothetical protein
LTKRRCNRINVAAMTLSAVGMLALLILSEKNIVPLGWTWLLLIGTFLTFSTGWLFGEKAGGTLESADSSEGRALLSSNPTDLPD